MPRRQSMPADCHRYVHAHIHTSLVTSLIILGVVSRAQISRARDAVFINSHTSC